MKDSFFIGYAASIPPGYRRYTRIFVLAAALVLLVLSAVLTSSQDFAHSRFAYGEFESFEGIALNQPVPHLLLEDGARIPLVNPGKNGSGVTMEPFEGARVVLQGQRIERGSLVMIEIDPGSVERLGEAAEDVWMPAKSPVSVSGEIVGAKCYLGVMNPGQGKTHAACARHCILGGVPAMLHVRAGEEDERAFFLTGLDQARLVELAGEHLSISGTLQSEGGLPVLNVRESEKSGAAAETEDSSGDDHATLIVSAHSPVIQ